MPPEAWELALPPGVDVADEELPLLLRENPLIAISKTRLHELIGLSGIVECDRHLECKWKIQQNTRRVAKKSAWP